MEQSSHNRNQEFGVFRELPSSAVKFAFTLNTESQWRSLYGENSELHMGKLTLAAPWPKAGSSKLRVGTPVKRWPTTHPVSLSASVGACLCEHWCTWPAPGSKPTCFPSARFHLQGSRESPVGPYKVIQARKLKKKILKFVFLWLQLIKTTFGRV